MFRTNEYFDGKGKSTAFASPTGPAALSVRASNSEFQLKVAEGS